MAIFNSYVSLPEGIWRWLNILLQLSTTKGLPSNRTPSRLNIFQDTFQITQTSTPGIWTYLKRQIAEAADIGIEPINVSVWSNKGFSAAKRRFNQTDRQNNPTKLGMVLISLVVLVLTENWWEIGALTSWVKTMTGLLCCPRFLHLHPAQAPWSSRDPLGKRP